MVSETNTKESMLSVMFHNLLVSKMFKCLLFPAITKTQSWKRKVESGKPGFDPGGVETDQFRQYHKIGKKKNKCCTFPDCPHPHVLCRSLTG